MIARSHAQHIIAEALNAELEKPVREPTGRVAARLVDRIYGVIGADASTPPEITAQEGRAVK